VDQSPLADPLTGRELEILDLLAQRLSNKEIAAQLVISPRTVKRHTLNIYNKLEVNSRLQAVKKASDLGILV
jgi:LuxR family maltose regulon positive regulatory protein